MKLDAKSLPGWVRYLKDTVLGGEVEAPALDGEEPEVKAKAVTARRMWAFDQLLQVARNGSLAKDDALLSDMLEFLAVLGWFEVRKAGKGAVSLPASLVFQWCAEFERCFSARIRLRLHSTTLYTLQLALAFSVS